MGVQQTEREKKQRDIFDRFMVSTAYGNHQCRHKSKKKATPWQQTGLSECTSA